MLESKKENLNRRMQQSDGVEGVRRHSSSRMESVVAQEESRLDDETSSKYEETRQQLSQYYENRSLVDQAEIDRAMLITYPYQRYQINRMTVTEMLQKWPFLGLAKYLLLHFKYLTTIDAEAVLRSSMTTKCEDIYNFMTKNSTLTRNILEVVEKSDRPLWPLHLLPLMLTYFREEIGHVLNFFPVRKMVLNLM